MGYVAKEWSLTYRFGIAALMLAGWCRYKSLPMRHAGRQHLYMFGTGLFLFSANYVMVYWGTQYLTSGLVAVTFSLLTFLNIINGRIFLNVRVQPQTLLAAVLGVVGLMLIFKPEIQAFHMEDTTTLGLIICIATTALASLGNTIVATKTPSTVPLLPFNAWAMAYGTLCNLAFALVQGEAPSLDPRPEYYLALLYLAVLGTVIAFTLYLWLLGEIGVARSSYMAAMTPLVALMISTLFEGYHWTGYAVLGVTFVLLGNILMSISKSQKPIKS